jgi:hypothetical protein
MGTIRRFSRWSWAVMLMATAGPALADVLESFNGFSQGAYGTYLYNGFRMVNALCNSQNARSGNAVRLNNSSSPDPGNQPYLEYVGTDGYGKDGGVGLISFWYRNWDGDPPCVHAVTVSIGGGPYENIGTINTTSITYQQFSFPLNNPSDDIKIRVQRQIGERLHVDDFFIQDFAGQDTVPPQVYSVTVLTSNSLDVLFSEPVEQISAETEPFYLVLPIGMSPVLALRDAANLALVHLTFTPPLDPGYYTLQVAGVLDFAGNPAFDFYDFQIVPGYFGTVVITEVMYDDTEPTDAEWIEVHNTTDSAINIGGWIVTDAAQCPPLTEGWFEVPPGIVIGPGEYLVLATLDLPEIVGEVVCMPFTPTSFDNNGDNIAIYTELSGGQLVDGSLTVNYPDMAYSNAGNSIEKCDPTLPWSGSPADWHQSVNFYGAGRYQSCSPGFPNSPCGTRDLSVCGLRLSGICGLPREIWNPVSACGIVTFVDPCRTLAWLEENGCAVAIFGQATLTIMQNSDRLMAPGDFVCVNGYLGFYNGLSEYSTLFTVQPVVTLLSEGNLPPAEMQVPPPQIATAVVNCEADFLESRHLFVENVTFVDGNGTNTFAASTNYPLVSGTDTVVLRVHACDTLVGHTIPVGPITLHGILQQFDVQSCYCEGYQVVTGRLAPFGPLCPVRPPNDDCTNPLHVPGEVNMPFTTVCATTDGPEEPALCMSDGDSQVGSDIWFCYLPECDGLVTVSLCGSNYDTKLAVYQTDMGCGCPPVAVCIACNDNFCGLASQVSFPVQQNGRYLIRVGGQHGAQGDGIMTIWRSAPCPPPNDNCASAFHLTGEANLWFSNIGATTDGPDEPALCNFGGDTQVGSDIWYAYTPECDGNLTVSLCGSSYDSKLAIYQTDLSFTCPTVPSAIACDDNFCGLASQVAFPVVQSSRYLIRIGGQFGAQGNGTLAVTRSEPCPPPPNNNCADAIHLTGETTVTFSTLRATTDGPDEPALCNFDGDTQVASDIWYGYTPECDGNLTVSLCGSGYDTKMAIYQTDLNFTCPTVSSAIACDHNSCGVGSQVTFPILESNRYLIRIGGQNGLQGDGIMQIWRDQPCQQYPCVNVGYIQLSPSDGLLNHYGRINTFRVELTNYEPEAVTVPLMMSDCEQVFTYEILLGAGECRLATVPMAWTPNIECQPNFLQVSVVNEPGCPGNPSVTKPLPVARTPYGTISMHDGVGTGNAYVPPASDVVVVKFTPERYPCTVEYVGLTMASRSPDTLRDPLDVLIYDDSGPGGLPGNVLMVIPSLVTRRLENYGIYAIPSQTVTVNAGSFYAGFRERAHCAPAGLEGVNTDVAYDYPGTTFLQMGSDWEPVTPAGDLMVDAYVRCPCPTEGSSPTMGYTYITSDHVTGPEYDWVDISTVGITWSDSCPGCTFQPVPTPIPYDLAWYNSIKISLNGFISFQPSGLGSSHQAMPNASAPNAVIAPLWTESESCLDYTGEVYYYEDPADSRVIVQWDNILAHGTDRLTFEAILYPNGDVLCQYENTPSFLDYTVGLESAEGTQALAVYQEGGCPPIHDNFAILFSRMNAPPGVQRLVAHPVAGTGNMALNWEQVGAGVFYNVFAHSTRMWAPWEVMRRGSIA